MGGGKGGSDFDPKGKTEGEVRRFCEAFMTELCRYIGPSTDVPAGDIGVGGREIGYMYGQYKVRYDERAPIRAYSCSQLIHFITISTPQRLTNKHGEGVLTGKSILFGGSPFRPEATGYGLVYITKLVVDKRLDRSLDGMRCAVSGSGNVSQYACQKLLELGAKVITVSDSNGVLVFEDGMTEGDWNLVVDCKQVQRGRLSQLDGVVTGHYIHDATPWSINIKYDIALPCATQNEIDEADAARLVQNGILALCEGANLPTSLKGQQVIREHPSIIYIPGKASNAGGVGVSGFEMSQNAQRLTWAPAEVDARLQKMMSDIYDQMENSCGTGGTLEEGANRAGFLKVSTAMKELGWIY